MYISIYQGKKRKNFGRFRAKTALISLIWNQACHIFYDKNKTDCAKTKKEGRTKIVYSIYETTERDTQIRACNHTMNKFKTRRQFLRISKGSKHHRSRNTFFEFYIETHNSIFGNSLGPRVFCLYCLRLVWLHARI